MIKQKERIAVLIIAIIIILASLSCSKEEFTTSQISLNLTFIKAVSSVEMADRCREAKPTYAIMTTNKGIFKFKLIPILGGFHSEELEIEKGKYKVLKLELFENEVLTHKAHIGPWDYPLWLDGNEYEFEESKEFQMAIECN